MLQVAQPLAAQGFLARLLDYGLAVAILAGVAGGLWRVLLRQAATRKENQKAVLDLLAGAILQRFDALDEKVDKLADEVRKRP